MPNLNPIQMVADGTRREDLMRLLRDLMIVHRDITDVEEAIRSVVEEFNVLEARIGHRTASAEYYLNLAKREG